MSLFEKVIESTSNGKLVKYQNLLSDSSELLSLLNYKNDNFEAFSNLGVSSSEMEYRVKEDKLLMERLAFSDVFRVEIYREAPTYSLGKSILLSRMIQTISITEDAINNTEEEVGSGYMNRFDGVTSGDVQITAFEFKQNDWYDFLTQISPRNFASLTDLPKIGNTIRVGSKIAEALGYRGKVKQGAILPTDGSYLLPKDYYFRIKVYNVEIDQVTKARLENVVIDREYVLDGAVTREYDADNLGFMKISASFKPLMSFE